MLFRPTDSLGAAIFGSAPVELWRRLVSRYPADVIDTYAMRYWQVEHKGQMNLRRKHVCAHVIEAKRRVRDVCSIRDDQIGWSLITCSIT